MPSEPEPAEAAIVVPIREGMVPQHEAPQAPIEQIERLLERAKAGEMIAFAFCYVDPTGTPFTGWTCPDGQAKGAQLLGATFSLTCRLAAAMLPEP